MFLLGAGAAGPVRGNAQLANGLRTALAGVAQNERVKPNEQTNTKRRRKTLRLVLQAQPLMGLFL